MFETPVKPAEWVWLEQDLARLKRARINTENKVRQELTKLDNYVRNVNKYSEWLKKLAYNADDLNLKTQRMIINMSILYSNKRKWIVKFGWYSTPVVNEFKNLKDVDFAKYMVGGEYHSLRYFGITANPNDAEDNDMYFCTSDPGAWEGRRDKILLFDDKKLFLRALQQWLDERKEYLIDTIKFAKKYKLKLDDKKVKALKEKLLYNAKYEVDKLTTELNKAKKYLSKCKRQNRKI